MLAFAPGDPVDRRVRAVLLDVATGASADRGGLADPRRGRRACADLDPVVDGQPPIMLEEFIAVDEIVKADAGWRAAMAKRGITDLDLVARARCRRATFGIAGEEGRRLLRVLSFLAAPAGGPPWAHPIDGVVAYVDLIEQRVVELIDHATLPVPAEEGNFDDPAYVGPARTSPAPHRDHPARGAELHRRRRRGHLGGLDVPRRVRPARGPGAAPALDPRR